MQALHRINRRLIFLFVFLKLSDVIVKLCVYENTNCTNIFTNNTNVLDSIVAFVKILVVFVVKKSKVTPSFQCQFL